MDLDHVFTPAAELASRITGLQRQMQKDAIDGALIAQNSDLYYFSGTSQQAFLYVPAENEPILMVRKDVERARTESKLDTIVPFTSPRQIPDVLKACRLPAPGRVGFELDVMPVNQYQTLRDLFGAAEIVDISMPIRMIRAIKSPFEIDLVRQAAKLSDQVAAAVPDLLKEGMTELELAGQIEAVARKKGHQGIVRMRMWGAELFYGHVMAGSAAAMPSYLSSPTGGIGANPAIAQGSSMRPIRRHEPILVDFVFAWNGYLSDHTRIFSLGDLPDDLLKAQEAMLAIQAAIKKEARPGAVTGDLYESALEKAADAGYADHFMGVGDQRIRFIGHGVGLELDEFPFLAKGQRMKLAKNMLVALEPKVILPGKGVVGIENTHVVTESGLDQLGHFQETVTRIDSALD